MANELRAEIHGDGFCSISATYWLCDPGQVSLFVYICFLICKIQVLD